MARKYRGILISFEGTEGSGKSTLIRKIATELKNRKLPVLITREPGGSPLAERIRNLILQNPMNSMTEIFLYEAARASHVTEILLPALEKGKIVLCDRFSDSSLAYQGHARGFSFSMVHELNQLATQGLQPDRVIFLNLPAAVGLKRAKNPNRFEKEGIAFQEKVRKGFLKARKLRPKNWLTFNVQNKNPQELTQEVLSALEPQLKKLQGNAIKRTQE